MSRISWRIWRRLWIGFNAYVLPDGPTTLGHPTNEDLFAGTPVRAATSWRVYLVLHLVLQRRSFVGLALLGG
jgi:hypothetical protein